jgi:hypothetical protein
LFPKRNELAHPRDLCAAMPRDSDDPAHHLLGNIVRKGGDYPILVGPTVIITWLGCPD